MQANYSAALAPRRRTPRQLPPRLSPWRRGKRITLIVLVLCALPTTISYVSTISGPSNSSFVIRSFEWLRDHGAAGIASSVEGFYYTLTAPSTGGSPLRTLPLRLRTPVIPAVHPPNVAPVITPALRGEGIWVPTETWSGAGHDAQHLSTLTPTLLVFVPLEGGESHTPGEGADEQDIINAARITGAVLGVTS